MRPTKRPQNSLSAPLNVIFGTESNVRVLRVLSLTRHPLAKAEVAARAALDASGVRRTLKDLALQGVVEAVGVGAHQPVRIRSAHPLARAVRTLFRAEAARRDAVLDAMRRAAGTLSPAPRSVWILLPETLGAREPDVLQVGVLASARSLDRAAEALRAELRGLERREDVSVEVRGYTLADLEMLSAPDRELLAMAVPLAGPPPAGFLAGAHEEPRAPSVRTHADLDRRARELGRVIGDRLLADPTLIERARDYVRRYLAAAPAGERKEMEEWAGILDSMPAAKLRRFLAEESARATRLRQSLPFLGALTPAERDALMNQGVHDTKPA